MEHFYQNIEGWFNYEYLYKHAVELAEDGDLFVEIGSFKGRSSAFFVVEIINSGKKVQLDLIDTWQGSSEHQAGGDCEVKEVVEGTLYENFLKNMKPVEGKYKAIRMSSLEAAAQYEDNSIDFIMIDGAHEFDAVVADIRAFLPKMKKGGIMCGDDAWVGASPRDAAEQELAKYGVTFPNNHFYAVIE
jgi:cephalosporin hydroxylase